MAEYYVHLVGSIPFRDCREVFETVSAVLGPALLRIPDGETGRRLNWLPWLEPIFAEHAGLELAGETYPYQGGGEQRTQRYRLKGGMRVNDIEFGSLLYAEQAISSYKEFARLKKANKVPPQVRFQVDLAHPVSVIRRFLVAELHAALEPAFERAMVREIEKIAKAIPHDQLAIQLDCASAVFQVLQIGGESRFGATKLEMYDAFTRRLALIGQSVPRDVELLYHLCYGDAGHRHSVEPVDMLDMVEMANRITAALDRPIQLFHMPVPRNRVDAPYFEPLSKLKLRADTKVSLGLIHYTDGVGGAQERLAEAKRFLDDFLIATECGFGRRSPQTIHELLDLHAAIAGIKEVAAVHS